MKQFIHALCLFFFTLSAHESYSQLDTDHYFPPLFGREDQGTHYLVLSTHSSIPFDVAVKDGAGNLITTLTISNASSTTYNFGAGTTSPLLVTEAELNTAMTNKGLVLSGQYPFYATVRVIAGAQATAMTSKGEKAALGKDFRTGHLFQNTGDAFRKSNVFGIMATEDNTVVTINDIRPGVIFRGTSPSGIPLTTPTVNIVLNEGETYVMAAFVDEPSAIENLNGVNGTHVTSDKPIVVSTGSWLGSNAIIGGSPSNGRDIGTDQIVPIDVIGSEYVIIKGEGIDNEKVIVVAAYDNTDVMINGNPVPVATIDAGDYYVIDGAAFSAFDNLFVEASNDVYVYQTANGGNGVTDDNERQNDLIFLPPIGCTGSKNVVLPNVNWVGTAYVNIIANAGANVNVNGVPLGAGDPITGTASYVTYKLTSGYTGDVTITSDDLIRVALINLSGNIGAACYFSGFTKNVVVQTQTINGDNIALEGCIPASFTFSLDSPALEDTDITYIVAGTANNGVDYGHIDNVLTIPAGQLSATVFINSISDGIPEGQESIYIIYQPDACSPVDTAFLFIDDAQPIEFTLDGTNLDCFEDNTGEILVTASGGFPNYTYHVTTNAGAGTTTQYSSNPITGLPAGQYSVQVYDIYGCKAEALVIGGVFDADTTFLPDGTGVSYTTTINISGFGAGELLDDMTQLQQICATMEHSYLGDLQITVISPTGQQVILKPFAGGGSCDLGEPFASGPIDGANSMLTDPGVGFEYCWNAMPVFGTMVAESNSYTHTIPASTGGTYTDNYLPQGSYQSFQNLNGLLGSSLDGIWTLQISDQYALDNGYIFNWNISLVSDLPDTLVTLTQPTETIISGFVTQAQCGTNDGAINIAVSGDFPPYTFLWSTGATTEDLSGIGAGTYEVYVTNSNGCVDSAEYILNNISSINTTSTITSVTCAGGTNGAIAITTSGGTAPYTFLWSNASTTEDLTGISAGNYTLTITDAAGCIHSQSINVNTLPSMIVVANNITNESCGTTNGSIDISVTGGSGSYGYTWSNGMSNQDISSLSAGSYTVTVIDGFGCSAAQNFALINDVSNCSQYCYLDALLISSTNEDCGNGEGALDISVINSTQPYTVSWSNGATTEDLTNLSAGTYTITINDANQCEHIESFIIGNNTSGLNISSNSINNENCGNGLGSILINVGGGTLPYSFNWSNSATSQNISGLSADNYTVNITDGNGCSFNQLFTVANNTGSLSYTAIVSNEYCNNNNGAINLSVTGASGTITYSWSNGATSQDLVSLNSGNYTCTLTDQAGCELITSPILVGASSGSLAIYATSISNENCLDGQGGINIDLLGGAIPYTYSWSNGATTEDITNLSAGAYSCVVTDDNGCSVNTGTLTVWNTPGTFNIQTEIVVDEICGNGQGAIFLSTTGGTAPYNYSWSDGSTNEDNIGLSAGNYNLTATDASGCVFNLLETISNTSGTLQIDNAVLTNENCGNGNGAINLYVSGGTPVYTYNWSSGPTTQDLNSIIEGNYFVTVTDANGCETSNSYAIINNTGTLAFSSVSTAESCSNSGGAIDLTVTGGTGPYTFLWSNAATSEDLSAIPSGTYSCVVTDAASCSMNTGSIVISNNPGTLIVAATVVNESCSSANGSVNLTVSGGTLPYTFAWSNAATSEDISGLSAGNYSFTVIDAAGCTVNGNEDVINTSGSFSVIIASSDELCNANNGAINLSPIGATGFVTYVWNTLAITEDLVNLSEGTYSCSLVDAAGCSINTGPIIIANNSGTLNLASIAVTNANCGNLVGSINITTTGGNAPLTYAWSNLATTEDILLLSAGNYSCSVTDASGCTLNIGATVNNDPSNLQIFSQLLTNESCNSNNGAIDITVAGGTPAYSYLWSTGATSQDISALTAGTYTVSISDVNSCSFNTDFNIINSGGNMIISGATIGNEVCGNSAGSVNITLTDGTAPFVYNWSNGAITEDISGLPAGLYSVMITDFNGCTTNGGFTIGADNGTLNLVSAIVTNENCGDALGAINITVSGGSAPITYDWSNGAITQDLSGLSAGAYSVFIEDQFGCNASTSQTIINNTGGFTAALISVVDENCGDGTGAIDVAVTGGTGPYTFVWSNAASSEDLTNLNAGNYTLTVTDAANCSTNISAVVNNNAGSLNIASVFVQDANCISSSGFIDLTISGGMAPYAYLWNTGATSQDISGLAAGFYSCQITDNLGCILNYSGTVANSGGSINSNSIITDATCGNSNGEIEVNVSGGINPFTFNWVGASPSSCCSYTLNMQDLGNSWNGASVTVLVNGTSVGNYTVTGGGVGTGTFNICDGQTLALQWNAGGFDNEVSFQLLDASGATIFSQGASPTPGIIFNGTGSCPTGPPNSSLVTGLAAGSYSLTITDAVGCQVTEVYTVQDVNNVQINVTTVTNETCGQNNGQIVYNVTGGTAPYTTTANGLNDGPPVGILSNLYQDNWEIITTDADGCQSTTNVLIDNTANFTINSNVIDESCSDMAGAIDLTLTGGGPLYTYSWSNGATSQDISNLVAGTYTCTIINQSGGNCEDNITLVVTNDVDFTVSEVITDENCGDQTGAIDLTLAGSTSFSFGWSNSAATEDISGLAAGTYSVVVINDITGCGQTLSYDILNSTTGITLAALLTEEWCGNADGEIDLSVTGGVGPYIYAWSNGATSQDLTGLIAGSYSVTATDLNDGCQTTSLFEVLSDGSLTVNLVAAINESCGQSNGSINISVTGPGSGGATYLWSNGATSQDLNGISAGNYSCLVTSTFGCEMTINVDITNSSDIVVASSYTNETCSSANGSIDLTVGGSTSLTYAWSNGATTEDLSGLTAGIYTCTITNTTSGCAENISITLIDNSSPDISINYLATDEDCGDGAGSIDITVIGGTSLTFDWDNGATSEDLTGLNAGLYVITVTNTVSGCVAIESISISNITNGLIATEVITNDLCGGGLGAIDLIVSGGTGPYSFSWSNLENTEDLANLLAGNYSVLITDDFDNCQLTLNLAVGDQINFTLSGTVINSSCATCITGSIDASVNELIADGPYTYLWSSGQTTEDIAGLSPGVYTLTVTGASGCQVSMDFTVGNNNDVGIDEATTNAIALYPNPAKDYFNLTYSLSSDSDLYLYMTNSLGQTVYSQNLLGQEGITEIDISTLSRGIYFVHVSDGKEIYTLKIIVARK